MAGNRTQQRSNALNTMVDGLSVKSWMAIAAAIAIIVLGFGAWWTYGLDRGEMPTGGGQTDGMAAAQNVPQFPPVAAYYDGERVFFAHTETSDATISDMLTGMMGSAVITVPELSRTPGDALGPVYVFTNGVRPDGPRGPLGFQPDVFDSAPGDPDYTPLRHLVRLAWSKDAKPRLLTSSAEVEGAVDAGELSMRGTGVVVNAPMLIWPGGQR